ncbi:MAG: hypothetical protein M3R04_01315 [bacterium]|nr:hypothetical protein [bacterium]
MFTGTPEIIGLWIAGLLTVIIFSFLYKDNPVYKVAEHLFLGVSLGYGLSLYYWNNVFPQAIGPLFYPAPNEEPNYLVLIPMTLGLFVLLRMVPKLSWLSRSAFAVYIGGSSGILVPSVMAGTFLPQLVDTMQPLWVAGGVSSGIPFAWEIVTRLLILAGVFCTLLYFFYSIEHKGAAGTISRIGVFFIMLGFGASFGNTVMARVSLLIGRFQFLLYDWWGKAVSALFNGG